MIFMFLRGIFKKNFKKNGSQKPSMLEQKQGQFWNLHRIPNKTLNPDFQFFLIFFSNSKNVNKIPSGTYKNLGLAMFIPYIGYIEM